VAATSETGAAQGEASTGRILVVDDDEAILRAFTKILQTAGHRVEVAGDGVAAAEKVKNSYDVIVSDIAMPGLDGVGLLRRIRQHDLDVPVILVTGQPQLETAMQAVGLGAYKYLSKPVPMAALLEAVREALQLHRMARLKREAVGLLGQLKMQLGDRAGLEARFELALEGVWMAYQPIVSWPDKSVFAFECLLRSDEPTLASPLEVLDAAERLEKLHVLGRRLRERSVPPLLNGTAACLFVNLHSSDLLDERLYDPDAPLSRVASRVVLEITERASLDDIKDVTGRAARLREMGFRIAIDDLGAGYAGLNSFAQLNPEFVKLDMSLVRNVNKEPTKRKLIASMTGLCRDIGIRSIAEGVETAEERDVLIEAGCDFLQGYLFAKPARALPKVLW
jgi:EAL domain-containing protein (putative c-di-GMP-specific phosphodiesterase class I)